jgi:hypothetical protein
LSNFGFFLPGNKDSTPWLWDSNLLALPQNWQKDSNLRILIRRFVSPLAQCGQPKELGRQPMLSISVARQIIRNTMNTQFKIALSKNKETGLKFDK